MKFTKTANGVVLPSWNYRHLKTSCLMVKIRDYCFTWKTALSSFFASRSSTIGIFTCGLIMGKASEICLPLAGFISRWMLTDTGFNGHFAIPGHLVSKCSKDHSSCTVLLSSGNPIYGFTGRFQSPFRYIQGVGRHHWLICL